jgi:hypothetical protein
MANGLGLRRLKCKRCHSALGPARIWRHAVGPSTAHLRNGRLAKQQRCRLVGLTCCQEARDPIGRDGWHTREAHAEWPAGDLWRHDFSGSRDDVARSWQLKLQPDESSRIASAATDGVDTHAGPTDVGSAAQVGVAAQEPVHEQIDLSPGIGTTLTMVA